MSDFTKVQKVWLITGCSQGLGFELSKAVLATGHKVIASSRNPNKATEVVSEIESLGGTWVPLDVTSTNLDKQFKAALEVYGHIDVLVNNAGIGMAGAVEDFSTSQTRNMFETNFFGPLRLIQLVTPHMRFRHTGTIINISAASTWRAMPGVTLYSASKCALDGLSESLTPELASFGIRVLHLVPGDMRTSFLGPARQAAGIVPLSEAYKGTNVDKFLEMVLKLDGKQPTDPKKVAAQMVDIVDRKGEAGEVVGKREGGWSRIPIGVDSGERMRARAKGWGEDVEELEPVWRSCEIDGEKGMC